MLTVFLTWEVNPLDYKKCRLFYHELDTPGIRKEIYTGDSGAICESYINLFFHRVKKEYFDVNFTINQLSRREWKIVAKDNLWITILDKIR